MTVVVGSGKRVKILEANTVDVCFQFQDFTGTLALAIAACTLGSSFQFGFNSGIVNAPEKVRHLTLKAPPIICSKRQFQILSLF